MKISRYAFASAMFALCITFLPGCDFIRASLGKPTSGDIAALRLEKESRIRSEMQRDSLEKAAADTLRQEGGGQDGDEMAETPVQPAPAAASAPTNLDRKYYVVLGCFKDAEKAASLTKLLKQNGYEALTVPFRGGFSAVLYGGSDTVEEAGRHKTELENLDFCPPDMWIYATSQKRHII
ncbi:MAG: SPOR domain-containing protein [Bacteroidales bacterium]|nr:SPOR domain-containing protein [Bacteroidales bacterium]